MRKPILPKEGDLLFEEKPTYKSLNFFEYLGFTVLSISTPFAIIGFIKEPGILNGIIGLISLVSGVYASILLFLILHEGFKNGFDDESFKAYYFSDKVVFYRISKHVDEIYTKGLSKEALEHEILSTKLAIELMGKQGESTQEFGGIPLKEFDLEQLEKGRELIERGLGKPHKFELLFSEMKYFINENNQIKMVLKVQEDESKLDSFYNFLPLASKYKKHRAEIVEFLNQRVAEASKS